MLGLEKETLILLRENLIETIARSSDAVGNIDRRIAILDSKDLEFALGTSVIEHSKQIEE
jgi:hypothetical protein